MTYSRCGLLMFACIWHECAVEKGRIDCNFATKHVQPEWFMKTEMFAPWDNQSHCIIFKQVQIFKLSHVYSYHNWIYTQNIIWYIDINTLTDLISFCCECFSIGFWFYSFIVFISSVFVFTNNIAEYGKWR